MHPVPDPGGPGTRCRSLGQHALAFSRAAFFRRHIVEFAATFDPKMKVSIDSRGDADGEAYYLKHRSLAGRSRPMMAPVEELLDFLETNKVRTIVTRPLDFGNWREGGFLPRLEEAGWNLAYNDERSIVLRRY